MTPAFTPPHHDYGGIPIYTSGLNKHMCQLAGELCDGFHVHPFHTAKYLRETVMRQVAFYGSTRTYKPVFDAHGWGNVTARLNEKTAKGDWKGMPNEIT